MNVSIENAQFGYFKSQLRPQKMGKKPEAGTPKALSNAMKSKGMQKLRFFCQLCQKQCRDENGFKCHLMSEVWKHRIPKLSRYLGSPKTNVAVCRRSWSPKQSHVGVLCGFSWRLSSDFAAFVCRPASVGEQSLPRLHLRS